MPSLTIKDIPDVLLTRLRQQAAADQRSLNREVIHLLDQVLSGAHSVQVSAALAERIETQVRTWRTLAGRWDSDREPAEEISELYAARTTGRSVNL
jgi:plasmid stability protein